MTNPLIEKFYELHPEKKEKPKPPKIEDYKGEKTIADKLKELRDTSTISVANPNSLTINSNGSNYINATNASVSVKPKALQTYDVDVCKDTFLQIAERVKQGDARITCVKLNRELVSGYPTGLRQTFTFEVQY